MSQTWTDNPFASGNVGQTDLQNIENNFLALKSMFSGAGAPSNPVAGMPWFDTGQKVLKTRNNDNDAWLGLFHGDVSEKRLVYRDAALEGYARDDGVTDRVIALKGGGTYTTGGATAGSWDLAGFEGHKHKWYENKAAGANHDTDGNGTVINRSGSTKDNTYWRGFTPANAGGNAPPDLYTDTVAETHDASDRIAAAVCILIFLDL